MDMGNLLVSQFPELSHRASELRGIGLVKQMRAGGRVLLEEGGLTTLAQASVSRSDTVRGWAAMAVGAPHSCTLEKRLELILPFADDSHFAVREWAWLSVRPHIAAELDRSLALLEPWTGNGSDRLRRFASEVTRPRGVWSRHIPSLKRSPWLGLSILTPLQSDSSKYVQDSVANWLNDASRSQPAWVLDLCERWERSSCSAHTARICRRATRSIRPATSRSL